MQTLFLVLLAVVGTGFGSFLCCQVRRLHIRSEKKRKKINPRSICLSCNYQLRWYDNIPVLSWVILRGKCRKCGKKIGVAEILSEIGTGLAFLMLGTTVDISTTDVWGWRIFGLTMILTLVLIFLAIYDGIYGELPTWYLVLAIVVAVVVLVLKQVNITMLHGFETGLITSPLLSVLMLGGLYLILYLISKGKWVGDGDWLLATAIGLALGEPWLALIALCLANFLACVCALPRLKETRQIHLGPFLVVAFVVTMTMAEFFRTLV